MVCVWQIYSASSDGDDTYSCRLAAFPGTSMSCPIAAGASAMVSTRRMLRFCAVFDTPISGPTRSGRNRCHHVGAISNMIVPQLCFIGMLLRRVWNMLSPNNALARNVRRPVPGSLGFSLASLRHRRYFDTRLPRLRRYDAFNADSFRMFARYGATLPGTPILLGCELLRC